MLDIKFIRDNPEIVQRNTQNKGYDVSISRLLEVDEKRRSLQQSIDLLRQERNSISESMKKSGGKPDQSTIERGKQLKEEIAAIDEEFSAIDEEYNILMNSIPNIIQDDVPIGDESASTEVRAWGEKSSGAKDHLDFANSRGWVDFERGAKVAGAKFYYLSGDLALLENAITQYALDLVIKKGFKYLTVPVLVNNRIATGTGFTPRTSDQSDEYHIEGEDLSLIATAEIPITGYHADEIIDEDKLPLLYAGYSPSFRKEAGAYGKHTRGLFRVHQFNKLELYAFTTPEQSKEMHETIVAIEEEIWQSLGIPYHVINIASGDLGAPASKKYDLEYWSPVDEMYREITSASNCTDYQARNLNIRVRRKDGSVEVLHTLNGTAVSLARSLVAILEHYQTSEGNLTVPEVLRPYMQGRSEI
jgi:seryl-tRNA synthetase